MPDYRTEVIVPPDRYLCLQLPSHLPEGRVIVTVTVHAPAPSGPLTSSGTSSEPPDDIDREDIEWWEEFEDEKDREGPRDEVARPAPRPT